MMCPIWLISETKDVSEVHQWYTDISMFPFIPRCEGPDRSFVLSPLFVCLEQSCPGAYMVSSRYLWVIICYRCFTLGTKTRYSCSHGSAHIPTEHEDPDFTTSRQSLVDVLLVFSIPGSLFYIFNILIYLKNSPFLQKVIKTNFKYRNELFIAGGRTCNPKADVDVPSGEEHFHCSVISLRGFPASLSHFSQWHVWGINIRVVQH